MLESVWGSEVSESINGAMKGGERQVTVNGETVKLPYPHASPGDWRDHWIYFILLDRFDNPDGPPACEPWDGCHGVFQGGNFDGVRNRLDYLKSLGAGALWLSPVFKNCASNPFTYHGYGIQDFLSVDPRFGTDGELRALVDEAHARGMYVILDIVLNHAGDIFEYDGSGSSAPWRDEPYTVRWKDQNGDPRPDWTDAPRTCHRDAAVWPEELRDNACFRRKGKGGEAGGDFESLKEFVTELEAETPERGHHYAVQDTLIRVYQYAIAKYDIDGFRIDTLKYVSGDFARIFGNAMREFALQIGKRNFFTFGEVFDQEEKIASYVGRNASSPDEMVGVDAALDFPLFYRLPGVVKGLASPLELTAVYERRKAAQKGILSSHGNAGSYFVTFLDNHDMKNRFYYFDPSQPGRFDPQVSMAVGCLFTLQGVPCLYYGTEQGMRGSGDSDAYVREALWGKPGAFDTGHEFFKAVRAISAVRAGHASLRYGRQYFREVSGNGHDFGLSTTSPGIIAYARILNDEETLVAANTSIQKPWKGFVNVDYSLNATGTGWDIIYSNFGPDAEKPDAVSELNTARGTMRALPVSLKPMEIQILKKKG